MIRATFAVPLAAGAADTPSRTIAGVAVPYGTPGRVSSGETVIFEPGSLDASSRPVALRDHDRSRPIGRVVDAVDRGDHVTAAVRVSATRDGDEALILAGDGVLGAFSVGVDPTDWSYDEDGTLHVAAGDWIELSLLTIGAYPDAAVTHVAASIPEPEEPEMPLPDPDVPDQPDPDEPDEPIEASRPVPLAAARSHPTNRTGADRFRDVGIGQLSRMIAAAQVDETAARDVRAALAAAGPIGRGMGIQAALADITLVGTNNVAGAYRPAYQVEMVDIVAHGTPQIDALSQRDLQRGDWPTISYSRWNPAPTVALYAPEKSPVPSTPAGITVETAPVVEWAGGNDISQATLDLGSPTFVEDYIRAAGVDYAKKADTYAVSTLLAAATDVAPPTDTSFVGIVGALFAALNPANVPAGSMWLGVSWDQASKIIGVTRDKGPAFWDGSISFGSFIPTVNAGGLSVFVDPNYPAGTWMMGMGDAASWYDLPGTPFNLRAVNAANLGLDVVVYGYGAVAVKYPDALVTTTIVAGP